MILEFRELLHEMFNVLTTLGNKYELGDMTDPVKFELMMYLMYLAMADGRPTVEACDLIQEVSGVSACPEWVLHYTQSDLNYLTAFVCTVKMPVVFSSLVMIDNTLYKQNMSFDKWVSEYMVLLYEALGTEMININGCVEKKAETRFNNYIVMMKEYLQANLLPISATAQFDNQASPRFCGKCGTTVHEGDLFCTRCGARYED